MTIIKSLIAVFILFQLFACHHKDNEANSSLASAPLDIVHGMVSELLPNVAINTRYPLTFTFTNHSEQITAEGMAIKLNYANGFIETSNSCQHQLAPLASCQINGEIYSENPTDVAISALLTYRNGQSISLKQSTKVIKIPLISQITQNIPANILINQPHTFIIRYFNNSRRLNATNVNFTYQNRPLLTAISNTCEGTLIAGGSCAIVATLKSIQLGPVVFSATLNFAQGNSIATTLKSFVSSNIPSSIISGEIETNIPQNIEINRRYPLSFLFTNQSKTITATEISLIQNYPAQFKQISNTCKSQLAPAEQCRITGEILANNPDKISTSVALNYKQGPSVTLTTSTTATNVFITSNVAQNIPKNITTNNAYPFRITFTNNNTTLNATGVNITHQNPQLFSNLVNNCPNILMPRTSCSVSGYIIATQAGLTVASSVFRYNEGPSIPVTLTSIATLASLPNAIVSGIVETPLPKTIAINSRHRVSFVYTNKNDIITATNLTLTKNYPASFTEISNTCQAQLAPRAQCTIMGDVLSATPANITVSTTLNYQQGPPISLTASTAAQEIPILSQARVGLPPTININTPYTINLRFTNLSPSLMATGVNVTYQNQPLLTSVVNTCQSTLNAGESCSIIANITATTVGQVIFAATLNQSEGKSTTIRLQANAITPPILKGEVQTPLPSNIATGAIYPVRFLFKNISATKTATQLNLTKQYPPELTETTNTCNQNLSPGKSCEIAANITSDSPLDINAFISLAYQQGPDINLPIAAQITDVPISGAWIQNLPNLISIMSKHDIKFIFTNESHDLFATGLNVSFSEDTNFNIVSNQCSNTLPPLAQCQIVAQITPNKLGPLAFSARLNYEQGRDITLNSQTEVVSVPITATFSKLPPITEKNKQYALEYIFTNQSEENTATNIVTSSLSTDFIEENNTCEKSLAPKKSCTISGTLTTPNIDGLHYYQMQFDYEQGPTIKVNASTESLTKYTIETILTKNNKLNTPIKNKILSTENIPNTIDHSAAFLIFAYHQNKDVKTFIEQVKLSDNEPETNIYYDIKGQKVNFKFKQILTSCDNKTVAINSYYQCQDDNKKELWMYVDEDSFNQLASGDHHGTFILTISKLIDGTIKKNIALQEVNFIIRK